MPEEECSYCEDYKTEVKELQDELESLKNRVTELEDAIEEARSSLSNAKGEVETVDYVLDKVQ